jgi:hypothetical protein
MCISRGKLLRQNVDFTLRKVPMSPKMIGINPYHNEVQAVKMIIVMINVNESKAG